jgi:hypothetical protein
VWLGEEHVCAARSARGHGTVPCPSCCGLEAGVWRARPRNFEKKEHQLFGEEGFEKMVDRVASIERTLGIYDLWQFTPKV